MFPNEQSLVAQWIRDMASQDDITFAQATWGSLLASTSSPTEKAQVLGRAIIDALEDHRGVPSSTMASLSPFDQYRRAVAGQDYVWCSNLAAIFTRACTCFGIPARILAMGNAQSTGLNYNLYLAPAHATTEIFDASLGRWVWIDVTFYALGMELTGSGLINAVEVQRCMNDPTKISLLKVIDYSPITHSQTSIPVVASESLSNLEWYFTSPTIFSLYKAGQVSGGPTYFISNENDLFPQQSDLTVSLSKSLPTGVGISFQLKSGIKNFAGIQCQQTYTSDYTPLAPLQTSIDGTFQFAFNTPDAPYGQALQYVFNAKDGSGNLTKDCWLTLYYYSPEFYAQYGQVSVGQFVVDAFGFTYATSQIEDWIIDHPSTDDVALAQEVWGNLVSSQNLPSQNAQAVACALITQLQAHRGTSFGLPGISPFTEYQRAISGTDTVGSAEMAAIFSYACNCLGIPARVVNIGSISQTGKATNEVFDATLNRWIWIDLWDNIIGVAMADYGLVSSAELERCVNYPERLANLTVIRYDPVTGTQDSASFLTDTQLATLLDYFDGVLPLLYTKHIPLTPYPLSGRIVTGDFNGDGTQDFVLQNNAGIPLYLGTESLTSPFQSILQWWSGASYAGWGDPSARIITGRFSGSSRTDFIIHDSHYGALFTATGDTSNPFTVTWLWTPALSYGGWSDAGAMIVSGDFNGDGKTDFIIHNSQSGALFTATGDPFNPFTITWLWTPGYNWGNWGDPGAEIIPGDFNGDGKTDFIIHNACYAALYIATGRPADPFTHGQLWNPSFNTDGWADTPTETIIPADFNGDGMTDFIVQTPQRVALYTATGSPANPFTVTWLWTPGVNYCGWGDPSAEIIPEDLNGDGKVDFIMHNARYAAVFTATGNPAVPFTCRQLWNPGFNADGWADTAAETIIPGDFNGDGLTDFIAYNAQHGAVYLATGILTQPFIAIWLWTSPPS